MILTIIHYPERKFVGLTARMSVSEPATGALWPRFMPLHQNIKKIHGSEFYSMEVYDSLRYFDSFDPEARFNKWAAVQVDEIITVPAGMQALIVPEGEYAVFRYVGKPSEAHSFYSYIFGIWLPQSSYRLDQRPHMAIMGPGYKGEHPESEEDICIPVSAMSG